MTEVDVRRIVDFGNSLNGLSRRMFRLYQNADDARVGMKGLSGLSEARKTLEKITEVMSEEAKALEYMNRCMEQSLEMYIKCEIYLAEYAEESVKETSVSRNIKNWEIPEEIFEMLG